MATYGPTGHMQLPRADAIRSRLIDTFSLIEHLQGLSQAVPRHTIREILELLESSNAQLWPLKLTLEVAAWFILLVFILEILLMWISSFFLFWKNAWNVFDFVVTILSLIPETVVLVGVTSHSVWLQLLRICRVLRSLKLFARFPQIRVIILALVRALKGPAELPSDGVHTFHHGSLVCTASRYLEGA